MVDARFTTCVSIDVYTTTVFQLRLPSPESPHVRIARDESPQALRRKLKGWGGRRRWKGRLMHDACAMHRRFRAFHQLLSRWILNQVLIDERAAVRNYVGSCSEADYH